jgi:hypothetical protein
LELAGVEHTRKAIGEAVGDEPDDDDMSVKSVREQRYNADSFARSIHAPDVVIDKATALGADFQPFVFFKLEIRSRYVAAWMGSGAWLYFVKYLVVGHGNQTLFQTQVRV